MEGVVQIYEYLEGKSLNPDEYISNQVMYYVEGKELFGCIPKTGFPEHECAKLMHQALTVAQRLHSMGIYHRDIKIENMVYNEKTEQLTLLDWGHSLLLEPEINSTTMRRLNSNTGVGTRLKNPHTDMIMKITPTELVSHQFAVMFYNLLEAKEHD